MSNNKDAISVVCGESMRCSVWREYAVSNNKDAISVVCGESMR